MKRGCQPIYKSGVCCPVDWACPIFDAPQQHIPADNETDSEQAGPGPGSVVCPQGVAFRAGVAAPVAQVSIFCITISTEKFFDIFFIKTKAVLVEERTRDHLDLVFLVTLCTPEPQQLSLGQIRFLVNISIKNC
jgi:hypothetical protein